MYSRHTLAEHKPEGGGSFGRVHFRNKVILRQEEKQLQANKEALVKTRAGNLNANK